MARSDLLALTADDLVVGDRAVTERGRGQAIIIGKPTARSPAVKGAACVAGAAHGHVVADR